jgi:type II restriction/modification system DNA methylase subunit YeeA
MHYSWNEIKSRALAFSKEWADASNEDADAKPFLVEFFNVFGIRSRKVNSFEYRVKKLDDSDGYIDLLWKGTILIEMKSRGKNLDKAFQQAKEYIDGLKEYEIPKYILVSDFENFRLYDLETEIEKRFKLNELIHNVQHFGYLIGLEKKEFKEQDPANIKAAELMGKLHDRLKEIGYEGHPLEVYLVRLLFCLFADDTTIFNKQQFEDFIEQRTSEDGSDLASKLQELFQVLNTPNDKRFKNLDEELAEFPYVNGKLFEESLPTASFDSKMRTALLDCCHLNWSKISPAIFGSMFQSVMNPTERRNLGAHYTSEKNILKLIKPLFLDDLWKEFESVKDSRNKLEDFHKKLSTLKFLDPACGCGNFLVITYRELRLLEIEIIKTILFKHYKIKKEVAADAQININQMVKIEVDQFYGIEIEEFPARIAEVAMWLIDHQMNMMLSIEFGKYYRRLPLKKAANIICDNALRIDWSNIIVKNEIDISADVTNIIKVKEPPPHYNTVNVYTKEVNIIESIPDEKTISNKTTFDYILGNPPFIGKHLQNEEQKKDIANIFSRIKGAGVLDYVTCWYLKAAKLIQNTNTKVAFVSTNSISQGEQPGILWNVLFNLYGIKIHFAHRTFKWSNEARGKAAVHVVIIGFASYDTNEKYLFEYDDIKGEPHSSKVKNINPYLVEGKDFIINKKRIPICKVPEMIKGSMPNDGGYYLFTKDEKKVFLMNEPKAKKYFRLFIGGDELINNTERWCLWLNEVDPSEIKSLKHVVERINNVREIRLKSKRATTIKDAETPMLFGEIRQPKTNYLALPEVSSENRKYIPIEYISKEVIGSNKVYMVPKASKYLFAILNSSMHMSWVRQISGRLKSDFQYSTGIVYNNFPWPENPTEKQIKTVEEKAQKVLDTRKEFPNSSLADLYDPLTMPPALVKAHQELDKAVDLCYRPQPFPNETKRIEFFFELYEKYTNPLLAVKKTRKK